MCVVALRMCAWFQCDYVCAYVCMVAFGICVHVVAFCVHVVAPCVCLVAMCARARVCVGLFAMHGACVCAWLRCLHVHLCVCVCMATMHVCVCVCVPPPP